LEPFWLIWLIILTKSGYYYYIMIIWYGVWFEYFNNKYIGTFSELFLLLKLLNQQPKKFQNICPKIPKKSMVTT
jgi:hypothetical protein